MRFKGKLAVVTGAARGIGLACATRLAQDGAKVILLDVEDETGKKSTAEIGKTGEAYYLHCDVGQKAEVDRTFDEIFARHDNVDILINNAGITRRGDFLELSESDFDDVIRTNLKSVFLCGQKAAKQMVSKGLKGAIVNMSSTSVIMTMPTIAPYAASKGGISSLTRAMSLSLAPHGIRVNAVGPGTIVTELNRDALLSDPAARDRILSRTPIGRFGEGADVASVVAFLASDDAGYVTGQTLYIDGGRAGLNYTMTPKVS
jgi:NAD(P)-dependent dehydrogenase (short-subunit alcohol dehydrogenase family)